MESNHESVKPDDEGMRTFFNLSEDYAVCALRGLGCRLPFTSSRLRPDRQRVTMPVCPLDVTLSSANLSPPLEFFIRRALRTDEVYPSVRSATEWID